MNAPRIFATQRIAAQRARLAEPQPRPPPLHRRAAESLAESILSLNRDFPAALEIGALPDASLRDTAAAARIHALYAADPAFALAKAIAAPAFTADEERLPLAPNRLDLIVSILRLHNINDLPGALVQCRRALRPDGVFLAVLFGEGTLDELRLCLLDAERQIGDQPQPRIAPFATLQNLGNLLARAGFADVVADIERLSRPFADIRALAADLRRMGETRPLAAPAAPLSRAALAAAEALYAERFPHPQGGIAATFSLVHLIGHRKS